MTIEDVRDAYNKHALFSKHSIDRMRERNYTTNDVDFVMNTGKIIQSTFYPDNTSKYLIFGRTTLNRPTHVVIHIKGNAVIVTVYEPDTKTWDSTFTIRR